MAALVNKVRDLVNDQTQASWTDEQIETALDRVRVRATYHRLAQEPTKTASTTTYLAYTAPYGDWETTAVLSDSQYNTLTPDTADYDNGRWEFLTEPDWPVYLTGYSYDVYGAAADLLERNLTGLAGEYDFSADGGSYSRSQKFDQLQALIQRYRTLSRMGGVHSVPMMRSDVNVW